MPAKRAPAVESNDDAPVVEPAVEEASGAAAPAKKVVKKPEEPGSPDLTADDLHRYYHIPPAGYEKPKFPSSL